MAFQRDSSIKLRDVIRTAIVLRKQIKEVKGLYDYMKAEHESLLEIRGQHLHFGYQNFGINGVELGIGKGRRKLLEISKYKNWHVSGLWLFDQKQNYGGFNVGFTSSGLMFTKSLETMYVTDGKGKNAYIVRPELGLTVLGTINLTYGYNFFLGKNEIDPLSKHTIHLRITIQHLKKDLVSKFHSIRFTLEKDADRLKNLGIEMPDLNILKKF